MSTAEIESTILVNVLLGAFTFMCLSMAVSIFQSIVSDRKRKQREAAEKDKRDLEYHEARMEELSN